MSLFTRNIIISFVITALIIGTVVYAVNYLNQQRVQELNSIANQLATDTLSVETQYSLLENAPCEDFVTASSTEGATTFSQELSSLGDKLAYAEEHLGETDPQVIQLKTEYTLLEIRDYLLTKQLSRTCHVSPTVVLYFYSNNEDACKDECRRASYDLSYVHQLDPTMRVYSFDYDLDVEALKTLESLEKVDAKFPAFVINGKRVYGFTTPEEFNKNFPPGLFATSTASTTTTTTKASKTK